MTDFPALARSIETAIHGLSTEVTFNSIIATIPQFDGNPTFCKEWIQSLDRLKAIVTQDVLVVRAALTRSTAYVADYIKSYVTTTPTKDISWKTLSKNIQMKFGIPMDSRSCLLKLRQSRQLPGMSLNLFAQLILADAPNAFPEQEQLTSTFIQRELVDIFLKGLIDNRIRFKLIKSDPSTLTEAVKLAETEQTMLDRLASYQTYAPSTNTQQPHRHDEPMDTSFLSTTSHQHPPTYFPQPSSHDTQDFVTSHQDHTPPSMLPSTVPIHYHDDVTYPMDYDTSAMDYDTSAINVRPPPVKYCWICGSAYHLYRSCPQFAPVPPFNHWRHQQYHGPRFSHPRASFPHQPRTPFRPYRQHLPTRPIPNYAPRLPHAPYQQHQYQYRAPRTVPGPHSRPQFRPPQSTNRALNK